MYFSWPISSTRFKDASKNRTIFEDSRQNYVKSDVELGTRRRHAVLMPH
jgi:hypothetical protein